MQYIPLFFSLNREVNKVFEVLVGEHKKGEKYSNEGRSNYPWMKLWYRDKEVLISKVHDLTH